MREQTTAKLNKLLAAEDRDTGFLAYLPEQTVTRLTDAIEKKLAAERERLQTAIGEGTQRLPVGLGGIVRGILN